MKVEGDENHPWNQGRLCVRALALTQYMYHPDRITHPLKRVGKRGEGKWERISWNEAYDTVERKLKDIRDKYGAESVIFCQGTGRDIGGPISFLMYAYGSPNWVQVGLAGHACYTPRLGAMFATQGCYSVLDASQFLEKRYDDPQWQPPKYIIVWAQNPTAGCHDGFYGHWIVDCMQRGSKLIVVDPRVTWYASRAEVHLQNRPGVIHPASAVAVQSDGGIPNGWYVYGLFVVNFRGAKDKRLLEPVFISLDSGNALEPSHSQKLLSKMLVNATAVDVQVAGLHYEPNELLQRVRDRFHVRYTKLFDDFSRETQRLLRLRRQTVERYAKAEVARIREDIARLDTEEQRRILPVWEARIRDIEQRRDNEIAIIEGQEPARSYKQVGFGLLRVN